MVRSTSGGERGSARTLLVGGLRLIAVPLLSLWLLGELAQHSRTSLAVKDWPALALGLLANQLALCIFAARMRLVLRLFRIGIGWIAALRIHLQSVFYFFALPTTVGLEIARFVKVRQAEPSATVVQMSSALLLDRLLGASSAILAAMLCLPLVSVPFAWELPAWVWPVCILVGCALIAATFLWPRSQRLFADAGRLASERWRELVGLFLLSIAVHAVFAIGVHAAARGVGLLLSFPDILFAVSAAMLLVVIPVSFAGLGPAEVGAAGLFAALGYPAGVALIASALPYLLRLVGALQGAAWEMVESGAATFSATRRLASGRMTG